MGYHKHIRYNLGSVVAFVCWLLPLLLIFCFIVAIITYQLPIVWPILFVVECRFCCLLPIFRCLRWLLMAFNRCMKRIITCTITITLYSSTTTSEYSLSTAISAPYQENWLSLSGLYRNMLNDCQKPVGLSFDAGDRHQSSHHQYLYLRSGSSWNHPTESDKWHLTNTLPKP